MSTEVEALKEALNRFYAALNRGDMDAMAAECDAEIVRVEPEGFPTSGTYHGIAQLRELVRAGRGSWAEGACEPERIRVHGDKAVAEVHVHVRLQGATDWIDARIADGFAFRDGRISYFHTFVQRADALAWAGIASPP